MFSPWPAPTKVTAVPQLVKELAVGFVAGIRKSNEISLISEEFTVEHFKGTQAEGRYVAFRFEKEESEAVQAMFMFSVAGNIWNGQFTGSKEEWKHSIELLTSLKPSEVTR